MTLATPTDLTPTERQELLRRLKYGPVLGKEGLAKYALELREQILKKRKNAQA
jgi:hypothetical protein